jgi:hypothetical protein
MADKFQSYSCWLTLTFTDDAGWEGTHMTPTFEVMACNKKNAEAIARAVGFIFDNLPGTDDRGVTVLVGDKKNTLVDHYINVVALG